MERADNCLLTGTVADAPRSGRPEVLATKTEKKKMQNELKKSTMRKLARETPFDRKTLRKKLKKSPENSDGTFPYIPQKVPQLDDRIKKQSLSYATLGPVAQMMKNGTWEQEKHTIGWLDHTLTSKTDAVNRSHDPKWMTKKKKDKVEVPAAGS